MGSFLKTASKQVSDVRNYLRESASGNSIKYGAEKGKKHILYIPFTQEERMDETTGATAIVKSICAISGDIHEWTTADGKFKAVACLKDVIRLQDESDPSSAVINDGSCPFCDRITDAWNIYNYRKELEEASCKLSGEQRKTHLDTTFSNFRDERKAKEAKKYLYILVVKFRLNDQAQPIIGTDGLPEYDLKVMKLSASRVEKLQQQLTNSGAELEGSELIFEYPNVDDRRLLVSQSTTTPSFPANMITTRYPGVVNKINQDVAKFEWDGIEKSYTEWEGMSSIKAKATMDEAFSQWDEYQKECKINPNAKYLEYVVSTPSATPSITGDAPVPNIPSIPSIPNVPNVPNVAPVDATQIPNIPAGPTVNLEQAPQADPNAVFGANGAPAPSITI